MNEEDRRDSPLHPSSLILHPLPYDALLLVSFGGPEKPDEVMPFLENVTRGKRVPRERLREVAARELYSKWMTDEHPVPQ
jgi:hypothetical protein